MSLIKRSMPFYRRNLPHLQYNSGYYFVTFRLYGSIPVNVIQKLKSYRRSLKKKLKNEDIKEFRHNLEMKLFLKFESFLDRNLNGPYRLEKNDIASVVKKSIHFRDHKLYDLYAYCIMPNHVHMVFSLLNQDKEPEETDNNFYNPKDFPVTEILGNLKKYTSGKCNKILKRSGHFWQAESFDRLIRDNSELENCILYTLYNPVKAKLVSDWKQWPHSYCKEKFLESMS